MFQYIIFPLWEQEKTGGQCPRFRLYLLPHPLTVPLFQPEKLLIHILMAETLHAKQLHNGGLGRKMLKGDQGGKGGRSSLPRGCSSR